MSFLTKISIPLDAYRLPDVAAQLSTPYAVHQLIWKMYRQSPDDTRQFLHRVEFVGARPHILVLAPIEPLRPPPAPLVTQSKAFAPKLNAGDTLSFSLRANPTVSKAQGPGQRGKVLDVVTAAKLDEPRDSRMPEAVRVHIATTSWLERRQERLGIHVDADSVLCSRYETHVFKKAKGGATITYSSVDIDGELRVTDPDKLLEAVRGGIGRAKSWGCGFLLIRR